MYLKLSNGFCLRGWIKRPRVLAGLHLGKTQSLKQPEFDLLMLCDGATEISEESMTGEQREILDRLLKKRVVSITGQPSPIEDWQYYRYFPNQYKKSIMWSITGRCNFRCRHCMVDGPCVEKDELSTEQCLQIIDQMAECGIMEVSLTGGEALVRKDFWQLVDRFTERRIRIDTLYTNGWLLNEAVLDGFHARHQHPGISMSFDGIGWHDWMRGIQGAEQQAVKALKLCRSRGFSTDVEMCLHRGNIDDLRENIRFLREIGVYIVRLGNVAMTPLWKQHHEGYALTNREYIEKMIEFIPIFYQDNKPVDLTMSAVVTIDSRSGIYDISAEKQKDGSDCGDCHLCGSIYMKPYISAEGRIMPCMPMCGSQAEGLFPKVLDKGLQSCLSEGFFLEYTGSTVRDLAAACKECAACPYLAKCWGGCRAQGVFDTGSLWDPDRTTCMLWKEGYVDKIRAAADAAIAKYCPEAAQKQGAGTEL